MSSRPNDDLSSRAMNAAATYLTAREADLLDRARGGDERAYGELISPHRRALHAHCYRMLGSLEDADDALQEALLRAWRALGRFEGRSSLGTWLYRIATNSCLQMVKRRPARMLPQEHSPAATPHTAPGGPLAESVWIEPYPAETVRYEQRESVELAFIAALQHLAPRQRAVLLLREVLEFSAREVAEQLDTTVAAVNSALQRARQSVHERVPDQSQQATLERLGDERAQALVARYMEAIERADVDGLVGLLTEDAAWAMPPMAIWYRGREAVAAFHTEHVLPQRWRHLPARAGGQLAVGCYMWDGGQRRYAASVLDVLTLRDDRIAEVTGFINPALFARFGLPASVAG